MLTGQSLVLPIGRALMLLRVWNLLLLLLRQVGCSEKLRRLACIVKLTCVKHDALCSRKHRLLEELGLIL